MRVAYADPPYLGCCALYGHHHPDGRCWDDVETHRLLIERLSVEFPDGWALSMTSTSLRTLLPLCPEGARVGSWVKTFSTFKRGVRPAYAWEPVVFVGGRNPPRHAHCPPRRGGRQTTPKDFVAEPITLRRGLTGAKPARVCDWILDLLGVRVGDDVVDLFPGTGAMGVEAEARTARSLWEESFRADPEARAIADRHYNRQKVGAPQFVPPGRCLVLKRPGALWITSFPEAEYVMHEWAGAMVCSAFRRESGPLASTLIRSALAATVWKAETDAGWGGLPRPSHGWPMVTFVDRKKVRSTNPGLCFLEAGFERIGETKGGLLAFGIHARDLPQPNPPVSAQLALGGAIAP